MRRCACSRDQQPGVNHWLNAIDEAASVGVLWLVVSVKSSLSDRPEIWPVCEWAQQTHGMTVGLHVETGALSPEEIDRLKELEAGKTRLFVQHENLDALRHLEEHGIQVCAADVAANEPGRPCQKPGKMVFVNAEGRLYTCGMVQGNEAYCMGSMFEGTFNEILHDPSLPHSVPPGEQDDPHGCDGCPPLLARFLAEETD